MVEFPNSSLRPLPALPPDATTAKTAPVRPPRNSTPLSGGMIGTSVRKQVPTGPFPSPQSASQTNSASNLRRPINAQKNAKNSPASRVSFQKTVSQASPEEIKTELRDTLTTINEKMDDIGKKKDAAIQTSVIFEESYQTKVLGELGERVAVYEKLLSKSPKQANAIIQKFNKENGTDYTIQTLKDECANLKTQFRELNSLSQSISSKLNQEIADVRAEIQNLDEKNNKQPMTTVEYLFEKDKLLDKMYEKIASSNKDFATEKSPEQSHTTFDILRGLTVNSDQILHLGNIGDELINKLGSSEEKDKHSPQKSTNNATASILLNRVLTRVTAKDDNFTKDVQRAFDNDVKVKPLKAQYVVVQKLAKDHQVDIGEIGGTKKAVSLKTRSPDAAKGATPFGIAAQQQNYDKTIKQLSEASSKLIRDFKNKKIDQQQYLAGISKLTDDFELVKERIYDAKSKNFSIFKSDVDKVRDNMKTMFEFSLNHINQKGTANFIQGTTKEAQQKELQTLLEHVIHQSAFLAELDKDMSFVREIKNKIFDELTNVEKSITTENSVEFKQQKLDSSISDASKLSQEVADRIKKGSISEKNFIEATSKLSSMYHTINKQLTDNKGTHLNSTGIAEKYINLEQNLTIVFAENLRRIVKYGASRAIKGPELEDSISQYLKLRDSVEFQINFIKSKGGSLPHHMTEVIRKLDKHHNAILADAKKLEGDRDNSIDLEIAISKLKKSEALTNNILQK